jgi:hypothetical protein
LDGGGVRGIITLSFLERIEALLRERHGAGQEFRLADYFDLIGGTSTGAIIATALALGKSAAEVKRFYLELAPTAFRRRFWRVPLLLAKFESGALMRHIRAEIGDRTLDSTDVRTGLAIMTKRMDTGGSWVLLNCTRAKFWDEPREGAFIGNRHYPLATLVRASTAAPYYFSPERLRIGASEPPGLFIDGGVTPHNNPSLQLLMLTQMKAHGLEWPLGPEQLLLVSIGTGSFRPRLDPDAAMRMLSIDLARHALSSVIQDSQQLVLTLMQWMSDPATPWPVNLEIADLRGELLAGRPLLSFQRYDMALEIDWLERMLSEHVTSRELDALRALDGVRVMPRAEQLAQKAAILQVQPEHFPRAFDLQPAEPDRLAADKH